jgi:hypothetical protein
LPTGNRILPDRVQRLEIDEAALSRAVSMALRSAPVELMDWRHASIHAPFNQATGGLYRITGRACAGGRVLPWSLILKVVQASPDPFGGSADPTHANYWKREALIYQSDLLERLPGIRAPRCYGVDQLDGSAAWIWLEDVQDSSGSRWSADRYRLAARRLGQFNGAYLSGRPLPAKSYLSRRWVRASVDGFAPAFAKAPLVRDHPLIRRCWPAGLLDRVLQLWGERELFLDAIERLPQTFCHLDAFPRNLLIDQSRQQIVALDWSFAGIGGLGTELAPMVAASVCFYDAEPDQMSSIDEVVFDGYLDGLHAAGWDGDSRLVRLGYAAAAALRYGLFPLGIFMLNAELSARFERVFAHSATEILDRWAMVSGFLLDRADEARRLIGTTPARNP